ncbi:MULTISPECIES: hypothetical protein [Staphylococcus]|uniref:Pathogenicity island protein n=1 Tax=Staphylococcus agnetis TaxID=985762 RepID=A0AAW9YYB5_9STAP|nr:MULTISPECIES: hypothetical protein [Staphylococcus]NHM91462.1 hypothetical protein [Staphylococcus sp. 10602379]NJI03083.1 hypothetical protein [Staphylococcus agnetis]
MLKEKRVTTEQMLRIQRELDRCRVYSDIECQLSGINYKNGTSGIVFTHVDIRYPYNNKSIYIYDWESPEHVEREVQKIKDVIAGEALIK